MPRNAAELRAAAHATGWLDGPHLVYVGDGYSIPWYWAVLVSPLLGGYLWSWKGWLDTPPRKEPSRLHDWLYTPYGPDLIGATQEEADNALEEEMLAAGCSIGDTAVVVNACRAGGSTWFGVSSQGYIAPPLPGGGSNIIEASALFGLEGGRMKAVIVFSQTTDGDFALPEIGYTTVKRTGGWTESIWTAYNRAGTLLLLKGPRTDGFQPILQARAGCLNGNAVIQGVRLYEDGGGRGEFVPASFPGTGGAGDQPSVSLQCATVMAISPTTRRFDLRGVPDSQVKLGEFAPESIFAGRIAAYFASLTNTAIRGMTDTSRYPILKITTGGLVTCTEPTPFGIGDICQVNRSTDSHGRQRGGKYLVSAAGPTTGQFTLADWEWGPTKGGTARVPGEPQLYQISGPNHTSAVRSGNHKIGRGFGGYRGRNSRA